MPPGLQRFTGHTVIFTGVGSGIAKRFAAEGANVVLAKAKQGEAPGGRKLDGRSTYSGADL